MNWLKKSLDIFLEGSFLLAVASVCLCIETYLLLGEEIKIDGILPMLFFSTLFIYNYRLFAVSDMQKFPLSKKILNYIILIAVAGMVASAVFIRPKVLLFLFPFGILSLAYNVPLVRLRSFPFLKIFLIALIWAVVTVMIPAKDCGANIFGSEVLFLFVRRTLFIFALAIPFDIRDAQSDVSHHLKTFPNILGEKISKLVALAALLIYCALDAMQYFRIHHLPGIGIALLISAIILALLVLITSPSRSKYYFLLLLDGTMILQFLLVYLAAKI